ncbi:MAG: hypothetical protein F6J87_05810 [Spirulina sp. SIO3F2]|nr:hypothetical protein [Spirulina sp. SIO3F2]
MMIPDPDYPDVFISLPYRGCQIELARDESGGVACYTAWVKHEGGWAIAVPRAWTRQAAVRLAKQWIMRRF